MTLLELQVALEEMDLPEQRVRLHKRENVAWLIRNIRIRNAKHPKCFMVLDELRALLLLYEEV